MWEGAPPRGFPPIHSTFVVYLRLGFDHIADLRGYDHILFILALAAVYALTHWKHLLIM